MKKKTIMDKTENNRVFFFGMTDIKFVQGKILFLSYVAILQKFVEVTVQKIMDRAPGNGLLIGGFKVRFWGTKHNGRNRQN